MVKNFENKYAIYRPELPGALEKYAEIAVNDRYKYGNKLQSKIIIDSKFNNGFYHSLLAFIQ
jgi:hypothetical protein